MRLNPSYPLVRHEISNRLAIATDDDGFAVRFQFSQQAGKVGFCFVNIHFFHSETISQLVHRVNGMVDSFKLAVGYLLDELKNNTALQDTLRLREISPGRSDPDDSNEIRR